MPGGAGPHWRTLELFEEQGQPSDGAQGHGRHSAPGVTGPVAAASSTTSPRNMKFARGSFLLPNCGVQAVGEHGALHAVVARSAEVTRSQILSPSDVCSKGAQSRVTSSCSVQAK